MSVQLVIAEKPSVARSIAAVIGAAEKQNGYWQGGGYLVSWCIGHLVSFAEADQYDEKYCKWRYEDLPILPQPWQFIVPDEKKQQFEVLRALLNRPDVDSVTAATDAGREGELIFRFVYQMAGCTKPVKRLWVSSMEDAAIRESFANLRPDSDYDALYQSALCRAKADWLVGMPFVNVRCQHIGIFSLQHFIRKLPANLVGLLRRGFARRKRLYQVVGQIVAFLHGL